jgi:ubiquitin-like-conjugating enzyme ATG10
LSRTALLQGCARYRDNDALKDDVPESEDIVEDPALAQSTSSASFTCGQSIIFSPTFQVPVFYFTIHDSRASLQRQKGKVLLSREVNADGSPLTLEEIMNTSLLRRYALPEIQVTPYALTQPDASFPLLSQGDHPTLGTPSWFIHPCGTACAIGELIGERKKAELEGMPEVSDDWLDWLETWFMMIGGIVDL